MQIETKYAGTVEVKEEQILTFENGLPAFEDEKEYVLLPFKEGTPLFTLQSVHTPGLAFVLVNPFEFFSDYQVEIPEATLETLAIEKEEDVAIFTIMTVEEPFTDSTVNLQGPVIINLEARLGKQIALNDNRYGRKHTIFATSEARQPGQGG
ncbi:flagellar assembly protein FliW [Salsuginibacillus kocurii]|uniref:flagellar assembly protein FliW n=1 Tax=Salsuginibacillus kocurii TaxID=427078 RepID=UPI0003658A1A|nr:flagellar assembly protein FliW [Salsuginibacillus kocurii]